jgi:hypothetical protein
VNNFNARPVPLSLKITLQYISGEKPAEKYIELHPICSEASPTIRNKTRATIYISKTIHVCIRWTMMSKMLLKDILEENHGKPTISWSRGLVRCPFYRFSHFIHVER